MRRGERFFVYGGVVTALAVALGGHLTSIPSATASPSRLRDEPPVARIAVCDVYQIADKLIESDRYQPRVKEEQERLRAEIAPMETELAQIRDRGMALDPETEEARNLYIVFQQKQQAYAQKQQELQLAYQAFLAKLYVEAYNDVRTSTDAVADDLGYTHVIVSRRKDEKIETTDLTQVIQAVLARPVAKSPEGSDITDDVLKDLKL